MASYIGLVISAWCMLAVSNSIGHGLNLISEADMCKLRPMTTEEKVQKQKHTEGLHWRKEMTGWQKRRTKPEEGEALMWSFQEVVWSTYTLESVFLQWGVSAPQVHLIDCGWLFLNLKCFALCYACSQLRMFCFVLCSRRQRQEAWIQEQRWPKGCVPALADLQETHELSFACRPNSISYIKKCAFNPLLK